MTTDAKKDEVVSVLYSQSVRGLFLANGRAQLHIAAVLALQSATRLGTDELGNHVLSLWDLLNDLVVKLDLEAALGDPDDFIDADVVQGRLCDDGLNKVLEIALLKVDCTVVRVIALLLFWGY